MAATRKIGGITDCRRSPAPGQDIPTLDAGDVSTTPTGSAAAHVAGIVACLLSQDLGQTPAQIKQRIIDLAIPDGMTGVMNPDNTRRYLAYTP
ncbi:hypothetical protein [Streptomyces sp. NBC_00893]|uniref:hypothetical protein n=1 Tax=Streptomyces sp. NBC_00893 TaxID=2975862 RepID=UPI00224FB827|nr:hypothetical protein [Streptomyces sp. NBC_00893]MCX4851688.1 hypothetical protein [Streptomyces sp. NBC_00893]